MTRTLRDEQKGYTCTTCGTWHTYPSYVFAHTRDVIIHNCDCGAKHSIVMLSAKQTKMGKVATKVKT